MTIFAAKKKRVASALSGMSRTAADQPAKIGLRTEQAEVRNILHSMGVQTKLTIGQPSDQYEQEADRVAEAVTKDAFISSDNITAATEVPKISRKPSTEIQRAGIKQTVQKDVAKGMLGDFDIDMQESKTLRGGRAWGGLSGWIKFKPGTDATVPDSPKIGLVQIAKVVDDEKGATVPITDKFPQVPTSVQTADNTSKGIEGGFFVDKDLESTRTGKIPKSKYYIDQGKVTPGTLTRNGTTVSDKHGSKQGTTVSEAALTDHPEWERNSTFTFETYAQSDTKNYGGIRWGFSLTSSVPPLPLSSATPSINLNAVVTPTQVKVLYAESATMTDALKRFDIHAVPPATVQPSKEGTIQKKESGAAGGSSQVPGSTPQLGSGVEARINGLKSGGTPLDKTTRAFFEPRFGRNFGNVRIHHGGEAAEVSHSINARAFTLGNHIVFGSGEYQPKSGEGKRLLGHELTHVAQQGHDNIDRGVVRRYTYLAPADQSANNWKHPSGEGMLVADRGTMAVENKVQYAKLAWADKGLIANAESKLKTIKSKVKIEAGADTIKGKVPYNRRQIRTLNRVVVKNRADGTPLKLTGDCALAAHEVMGKPGMTQLVAMSRSRWGIEWYTRNYKYWEDTGNTATYKSKPVGWPETTEVWNEIKAEQWSAEIFKREFGSGLTNQQAREKYNKLSAGKKKAFDKKYGINRYAVPKLGQGITTVTEGMMPGFEVKSDTWNVHFGVAILKDAHDYTTLESIAKRADTGWFFWMYGPPTKKAPDKRSGQSFHQFNEIRGHGNKATTMVVEPSVWLDGTINTPDSHLVREPRRWKTTRIAKLPMGTEVRIMKKGAFWFEVIVVGGPHDAKVGWVMQKRVDQSDG